ncbi:MAG: hypothetical protein GYA87_05635 [Christensenellaceae bacterium]|nr:hypothetical protein [Christensenellaceae bacterium]
MFGYINIDEQSLSDENITRYKSLYCGLCSKLKERHGSSKRVLLSYDMTFLLMLLTSLYEPEEKTWYGKCFVHPIKKRRFIVNEISDYVADMNIIAAYFKILDDINDTKKPLAFVKKAFLNNNYLLLKEKYPRQCNVFEKSIEEIKNHEKNYCDNIDTLVNKSAEFIGEIFVYKEDYWAPLLRSIGMSLGRFIYLMDAYEDLDSDIKHDKFNPLKNTYKRIDYEVLCKESLTMLIAECSRAFELLPLELDIDIMRNILYSGVWLKYNTIRNAKQNKNNKLKRKDLANE